jgi:5-methylthioadenosine/S-adenosylhomocysteine deaminase
MDPIDLIVSPKWLIPVVPKEICLQNHSLVVNQNRIIDILPTDAISSRYETTKHIKLDNHALIPGLINAHTHASMSLMRGLADDKALMDWLNNYIWPAEQKWVTPRFIEDGVELAIAEMLLSGTTCFNDMYFFPDVMARTADRLGIRAVTGLIVLDFPTPWASNADEYLEKGMALFDDLRHVELVTATLAPHAPYTVSDDPLEKILMLSDELDLPVHIHLHETANEIEHSLVNYGKRPIARLQDLNLLGPNLLAVHLTQIEDEEIDMLAEHGVSAVHCPQSNMKLASGFCPLNKLLDKGMIVGIGTDGAASNNDLDMLDEMRTAALLAKAVSNNPQSLPAHQALEIATLGGARALGLAEVTGSLEVNKWADMTAIDLSHPSCQPLYDPISQVVYTASRQQVSDVWVAGNQLVENHQLTKIDIKDCLHRAAGWQQKINS